MRIFNALVLSLIITATTIFCGCKSTNEQVAVPIFEGLSVHYVDVGQGDAIFIRLPDGKNIMIDCGVSSKENFQAIKSVLSAYSVNVIDYFVLTHPDSDHVGNAAELLGAFNVGELFIPHVVDVDGYPYFKAAVEKASALKVKTKISSIGISRSGADYTVAFLSPGGVNEVGGFYSQLNGSATPTDSAVNNVSAVIYVEYASVRFLFTGDMEAEAENKLIDLYDSGMFNQFLFGTPFPISLRDVDFLKVSHHGAADGNTIDFLSLVKPKNAIISVGGNNIYGHPSTQTLDRLYNVRQEVNVYRTDYYGTVSVGVSSSGKVTVKTQLD